MMVNKVIFNWEIWLILINLSLLPLLIWSTAQHNNDFALFQMKWLWAYPASAGRLGDKIYRNKSQTQCQITLGMAQLCENTGMTQIIKNTEIILKVGYVFGLQ